MGQSKTTHFFIKDLEFVGAHSALFNMTFSYLCTIRDAEAIETKAVATDSGLIVSTRLSKGQNIAI